MPYVNEEEVSLSVNFRGTKLIFARLVWAALSDSNSVSSSDVHAGAVLFLGSVTQLSFSGTSQSLSPWRLVTLELEGRLLDTLLMSLVVLMLLFVSFFFFFCFLVGFFLSLCCSFFFFFFFFFFFWGGVVGWGGGGVGGLQFTFR